MTITIVPNSENVVGKHREIMLDITPDDDVQAGGETLAPAACGMKAILGAVVVAHATGGIAASGRYNKTTGKVTYYNGASELTGNQSAVIMRWLVRGY